MGQSISAYRNPDTSPNTEKPPTFDPLYGFANGRKERVMVASQEDMSRANLPLDKRDYCAHLLIEYNACKTKNWPFPVKCGHEKHAYELCEFEDYVLRMKEYERERRLLERAKRKRAKEEAVVA